MSIYSPGTMTAIDYDRAAREYLRSLPPEHFMEGPLQATPWRRPGWIEWASESLRNLEVNPDDRHGNS
jgi:hypothetical protein